MMVKRVVAAACIIHTMSAVVIWAGPEAPGVGGSVEGAPELMPAPGAGAASEAGIPYNEYFNYSAYARRSYSPGYTPHATSLFENPREYPNALCVIATPYYQYGGVHGWFFGSPLGYQSSVPKDSHALAYFRGELGITSNLRYGYPHGLRVIEPIIVPFNSSAERGGVFISGGGLGTAELAAEATPLPAPGIPMDRGNGDPERPPQLEKGDRPVREKGVPDVPQPRMSHPGLAPRAAIAVPTPGPTRLAPPPRDY